MKCIVLQSKLFADFEDVPNQVHTHTGIKQVMIPHVAVINHVLLFSTLNVFIDTLNIVFKL